LFIETRLPRCPSAGRVPPVANPHDHPTALKDLQDSIYRDKVLRARAMTPEEWFNSGFEIITEAFHRMLEGAMWQLGISDVNEGWNEVGRRLQRLKVAQEHGRYSTVTKHGPPDGDIEKSAAALKNKNLTREDG
jgi:hypothetical protein